VLAGVLPPEALSSELAVLRVSSWRKEIIFFEPLDGFLGEIRGGSSDTDRKVLMEWAIRLNVAGNARYFYPPYAFGYLWSSSAVKCVVSYCDGGRPSTTLCSSEKGAGACQIWLQLFIGPQPPGGLPFSLTLVTVITVL
jgi:hypothetical protein